jgi:hypothetical protein
MIGGMSRIPVVTTVAELEAMTPEERRQHFADSIVWDPSTLPAHQQEILRAQDEQVRAQVQKRAS